VIQFSLFVAMDDFANTEIQKKAELLESQYNTLKKEFRDYIETNRKNDALKKKELQSDFAKKMLVFADSLCRISCGVNNNSCDIVKDANENFQKNIDALYSQLLFSSGLTPVDPGPGDKFDDTLHMAVGLEYGSRYPEGSVFSVIRKGYMRENILIRPAEVIISKFPRVKNKNKKNEIWGRFTDWVFPGRGRFAHFDEEISQLEHARSETTLRFEEDINQLKDFVSQSLAEKQEIEGLMREQADTIERLRKEINGLKETVSQSLVEKQDVEYQLQVQAETIERHEDEMEYLKEVFSQLSVECQDTEIPSVENSVKLEEKDDYNTEEYKPDQDTDGIELTDMQIDIKRDS